MNISNKIFSIVLLCGIMLILFNCAKKKSDLEIYKEKSSELMKEILELEEYEYFECIIQDKLTLLKTLNIERPSDSISLKKTITKDLDFNTVEELEYALNLSSHFEIKPTMLTNYKITLERSKFDSLLLVGYNNGRKGLKDSSKIILNSVCPKRLYISKPIFNKDFTKAILHLDFGNCLMNPISRFEFENGKWINE